MDLFTVDTAGELNLLEQNEYTGTKIVYSNVSKTNRNSTVEEVERDNEEELNGKDEQEEDENYDYGGTRNNPLYL